MWRQVKRRQRVALNRLADDRGRDVRRKRGSGVGGLWRETVGGVDRGKILFVGRVGRYVQGIS